MWRRESSRRRRKSSGESLARPTGIGSEAAEGIHGVGTDPSHCRSSGPLSTKAMAAKEVRHAPQRTIVNVSMRMGGSRAKTRSLFSREASLRSVMRPTLGRYSAGNARSESRLGHGVYEVPLLYFQEWVRRCLAADVSLFFSRSSTAKMYGRVHRANSPPRSRRQSVRLQSRRGLQICLRTSS